MTDLVDDYFAWLRKKMRRRRALEEPAKGEPARPLEAIASTTVARRLRRFWNDKRG